MGGFSVNPENVKKQANDIKTMGNYINNNVAQIEQVARVISGLSLGEAEGIYRRLTKMNDVLVNRAVRMKTMGDALLQIVEEYRKCESELTNEIITSNTETMSEDRIKWWQSFINCVKEYIEQQKREKEEREREKRKQEDELKKKEKQQDLYMQSAIFDKMKEKAYSKATWKKASMEERKLILAKFMAEVCTIMGIHVDDVIEFVPLGETKRGAYQPSSNKVIINESLLSSKNSYELMYTIIHEMRHAYQHAVVDHPEKFLVSNETVEQWKNNFKPGNYKNADVDGYEAYITQPVEYDAKNFAKQDYDLRGYTSSYVGSWD